MARKKKSTNLVLPILGISLFTMLGITVYLNRPIPTPLRIAEVAAPVHNCASVAFTDNFAGTTLNATKWSHYSNTSGTATLDNKLTLFQPASATTPLGESNILTEGKVEIEGDFIQEVSLQSLTTTPETNNFASFLLGLASPGWKNWYRIEIYKNGDIQTYSNTNEVITNMTPVNVFKNTPTKLKVVRSGSTLTTYYDVGAGYVLHSTVPNIYTGKVFVQIDLISHAPDKPAVTAVVTNYTLRCFPPASTKVSSTCSDDGTKVTMKWDAVPNSSTYTLGVDDTTNNNSTSCTGLGGWLCTNSTDLSKGGIATNSYTHTILPNKKYNWWVHGVANGEVGFGASANFTCTPKINAPLNPRVTCTPDGKSVRLMWDGVVDAESYKVRLDDKKGKVTNFDNLKESQYIATVTPDKMYSFWVHSHKGDIDSNQSTAIDFTCKATSTLTPTPKPTVKPTIAPTPTPTLKPTVTPKASIYTPPVQRESTNLNDLNENVETTEESELKPTNPISKFFFWLAGLFE